MQQPDQRPPRPGRRRLRWILASVLFLLGLLAFLISLSRFLLLMLPGSVGGQVLLIPAGFVLLLAGLILALVGVLAFPVAHKLLLAVVLCGIPAAAVTATSVYAISHRATAVEETERSEEDRDEDRDGGGLDLDDIEDWFD